MDDIFYSVQQTEEIKKAAQRELDEAKQRRINFNLTFSTMEGFEVLRDIAIMCHANEISYIPSNQYETAFREGERNVFLFILSQLSDEMKTKILGGI